ncbi:MAG: hypothetical protein NTZ78_09255 [Candidatus Aureabacteria bacterium]|nr:hypothetical protein [Candidatus Auribacterota bacterium]
MDSTRFYRAWRMMFCALLMSWVSPGHSQMWTGPIQFNPGTSFGGYLSDVNIAVGESGPGIMLFRPWGGSKSRIYASRWNGAAWTGTMAIDAGTGENAYDPQITVNKSGNGIAWFHHGGEYSNYRIYANCWNGTAWTGATVIDAGPSDYTPDLQIAINESGEGIACFLPWHDESCRLYANFWNGTAWTGAVPIDLGTDSHNRYEQIAVDGRGNGIAVFTQSNRVYANRWDGIAWTGPTVIDAGTGHDIDYPQIAIDGSGKGIAVFAQRDGSKSFRVYSNRWDGTAWTGPTVIDAGTGENEFDPHIAVNESGKGIAWFNHGGEDEYSSQRIYANCWNGTAWTGAVPIDLEMGSHDRYKQIAVDERGNGIAVFLQGVHVYANHWNGAVWTGPTMIDAGIGWVETSPRMSINRSGNGIVVFEQCFKYPFPVPFDIPIERLYANCWDGTAWTGAMRIDAGTKDSVSDTQIAVDGNGNGIAVFSQDYFYVNRYLPRESNYFELQVTNGTDFNAGDTIVLEWRTYEDRYGYTNVPCMLYLGAAMDYPSENSMASPNDIVNRSKALYFFDSKRHASQYRSGKVSPMYTGLRFPVPNMGSSGTVAFTVQRGAAGRWVFLGALLRQDGNFPSQPPVEVSKGFNLH